VRVVDLEEMLGSPLVQRVTSAINTEGRYEARRRRLTKHPLAKTAVSTEIRARLSASIDAFLVIRGSPSDPGVKDSFSLIAVGTVGAGAGLE
jgi:hypothetical protein